MNSSPAASKDPPASGAPHPPGSWSRVLFSSRWLRFLLLICLLSFAAIAGCTTTIIPPKNPAQPVTVLVTDYGKHASLLLPDPRGGMEEYAFGDWYYFALGHNNLLAGLFALIHSPQSTLGRRWVAINADAPYANELVGAKRTESLLVNADRVAALRHDLDREFARHLDSEVYNAAEKMQFVRCDESYNLLHNCNTVTAEWLRKLGAKTQGLALYSRFQVKPR
jgi:hypothetical protein